MAVNPTYVSLLPNGKQTHVTGDVKEAVLQGTVGAADTYVTGGFALPTPNGANGIVYAAATNMGSGHMCAWNPSTKLLQVFSAAGTELANASAALQNVVFVVVITGV